MAVKKCIGVLSLVLALNSAANEWNQWRGPNRNGSTAESDWSHQWGKEGPKKLWEARIGAGYSNLCVSGKTGFTLGFDGMNGSACVFNVYALDLETGKVRWKTRIPPGTGSKKFGSTSFSSPVTDGKLVYALGGHGEFAALKADSG